MNILKKITVISAILFAASAFAQMTTEYNTNTGSITTHTTTQFGNGTKTDSYNNSTGKQSTTTCFGNACSTTTY
ncbi:MAG: hypothetical protein J6M05_06365 [Cardiobacteriaceae bacterium]|nr:hypothetical protein [Cardiobacteriaceae bacterium]